MKAFVSASGIATPLKRTNVDTDQIIPKQFLKSTERTGFGKNLFYGWRYDTDGKDVSDFVLCDPKYASSTILVAGENFGCGSSREHAVWAILDYGFTVIIAPSFADIFYNNCIKNGILPLVIDKSLVQEIFDAKDANITVQLAEQTVHVNADGKEFDAKFEIDGNAKKMLLQGLDEIALTLENDDQISKYENENKILPIFGAP